MADVNLLVVDNALDHDLYRPVEHWSEMLGFKAQSIHLPSGGRLPDVDSHSHVIITGCEGSILDMPPWAEDEADWVRGAIECGTAILGSCWGHQLIAVSLAGIQAVQRAARAEFGWIDIPTTNAGGLLPSGSLQSFTAHFDEVVVDAHPEMHVLATTSGCAVQAAQWGERPVWGIQAHPEIDPDHGTAFLKKGPDSWPESAELFHSALAGPVRDSGHGKEIARRFLETKAV